MSLDISWATRAAYSLPFMPIRADSAESGIFFRSSSILFDIAPPVEDMRHGVIRFDLVDERTVYPIYLLAVFSDGSVGASEYFYPRLSFGILDHGDSNIKHGEIRVDDLKLIGRDTDDIDILLGNHEGFNADTPGVPRLPDTASVLTQVAFLSTRPFGDSGFDLNVYNLLFVPGGRQDFWTGYKNCAEY